MTMKLTSADIDAMEQRYRANFINCLSGYKSANLIGTTNAQGQDNLAVFNSVFHVGANPPLLGLVMRPHSVRRDTLENIQENGNYTINHIHPTMVAAAHQTSAKYPKETSEFNAVGLTPFFSQSVSAPYVQESRVKIGMRCQEIIPVQSNNTLIIIGSIVEIILHEHCIQEDGNIDLNKLETVTISGLDSYHLPQQLAQFHYATPESPPKERVEGTIKKQR